MKILLHSCVRGIGGRRNLCCLRGEEHAGCVVVMLYGLRDRESWLRRDKYKLSNHAMDKFLIEYSVIAGSNVSDKAL